MFRKLCDLDLILLVFCYIVFFFLVTQRGSHPLPSGSAIGHMDPGPMLIDGTWWSQGYLCLHHFCGMVSDLLLSFWGVAGTIYSGICILYKVTRAYTFLRAATTVLRLFVLMHCLWRDSQLWIYQRPRGSFGTLLLKTCIDEWEPKLIKSTKSNGRSYSAIILFAMMKRSSRCQKLV